MVVRDAMKRQSLCVKIKQCIVRAGIAITQSGKRKGSFANKLSLAFRQLPLPVIGHIRDDAFILDLRCLDQEAEFIAQLNLIKIQ